MASAKLIEIIKQVESLTIEDQMALITHLQEQVQRTQQDRPRKSWHDIQGTAPYPMVGEDAQEWVTRTRREGDEARARGLRGES